MKYTVYDTTTGAVKRWGEVPEVDFQIQALFANEAVVEGNFDASFYWDGTAMQPKPASPGAGYEWDTATKAWVGNLAAAQAERILAMTQAYASAIAQDIAFTSGAGVTQTFQADPQSIANAQAMIAAYSVSGVPDGFYWLAKDNTQVPFTLADLQGLGKAMGDQGWAAFQRLQTRKASIREATSVDVVNAITW